MWLVAVLALIRCTPGTKPDPDCDPKLEAEVVKPDKCGKIKDPAGPFRWEYSFYSIKNQCGAPITVTWIQKMWDWLVKDLFWAMALWQQCDYSAGHLLKIWGLEIYWTWGWRSEVNYEVIVESFINTYTFLDFIPGNLTINLHTFQ